MVEGLGLRVEGGLRFRCKRGFKVWGFEFRVQGLGDGKEQGCRAWDLLLSVGGLPLSGRDLVFGCWVAGCVFRVLCFVFCVSCFVFRIACFEVRDFGCLGSGFEFRVSGFGFLVSEDRVSGFGIRVSGARISGFGFRASGFRVSGFWCRISGFEF